MSSPPQPGASSPVMKIVAGAAAVAVLAFGAVSISKSSTASSSAAAAPQVRGAGAGPGGHVPPGMGTPVSAATLAKLEAAVAAKYPGRVERADRLPDGSYVVHVIPSSGQEVHVRVSRSFAITGTFQGGPPPAGQAPPSAPGSSTS